ncbi:MAG: sulfate transporter family-domain-containing protein [Benjaminiella poitrasii]|nr:MAG: sulfate transporter family-domain-containing protein [Benjaminiella poitrasii]
MEDKHLSSIVIDYTSEPLKPKLKRLLCKSLPDFLKDYFSNVLPILQWIHKYNLTWLIQDAIAGITVGIVLVPQSMAYSKVANLDPQYGLYTAFVGVTLYCLLGTSKDISVGPISTVSLLVGSVVNTVLKTHSDISPSEVAITLGLFCGIIMVLFSVLRLGILVDFISEPAVAGFMTGSAITIVLGQWPKLFGILDVPKNAPPYLLFASIVSKLSHTRLDIAFGMSALVFLYLIRYICGELTNANIKSRVLQKCIFLLSIMRNGLIVIVGTFISFIINHNQKTSSISIIQSVPAGFGAMGIPSFRSDILRDASSTLPSIILILILEHITVAKSFGRISNYQINPDQEILAAGACNIISSFFGGFPSAGSFSRTAIMARSGSRTPLAGVFSGCVVVLALYVLTPAFYYIPDAVLAAVIIHAVSDLASSFKYLKKLWSTSISELLVWTSAVIVTLFIDIETGIYVAVGLSLSMMLYKIARPPIKVLGRIAINSPNQCYHLFTKDRDQRYPNSFGAKTLLNGENKLETNINEKEAFHYLYVDEADPNFREHIIELPRGILVLHICDSILYPNAEHISDRIVHIVREKTYSGNTTEIDKDDSEKLWNQSSSANSNTINAKQLPILKAIVLDFSAVCHLDATALDTLLTMKEIIDNYAGHPVEWHFAGIQNHHVRSSLLYAGFGSLSANDTRKSRLSLPGGVSIEKDQHSLYSQKSAINHSLSNSPATTNSKITLKCNGSGCYGHGLETSSDASSAVNLESSTITITENHPNMINQLNDVNQYYSAVPVDRYPFFHWNVDAAVKFALRKELESQRISKIEH